MERSDEELIAAYRADEREAFGELTRRHLSGVYSFALRLVGSAEEADDIAQETFVKAWKSLSSYNAKTSRFKTWLMRIARNTAIDFLRKKKHIPFSHFDAEKENILAETVPDPGALAEELFAKSEDSAAIVHALEHLSEPHRELLLLYYTSDLTFEEIGAMLGEPPNTTKSRHRRALRALREVLEQNAGVHRNTIR